MNFNINKFLHSISLRVPQAYALRSGMRVIANNRAQNSLFWSVFTSGEYLSFVPDMNKLNIKPDVFVDCGAATGYVTLLIYHLIKAGVLEWDLKDTICIEPSARSLKVLQENININRINASSVYGVVGEKSGEVEFYDNPAMPWSSSLNQRFNSIKPSIRGYVDLSPYLSKSCFLKVDIEGAEFEMIECYKKDLNLVQGIIIEWHHEFGDVAKAEAILAEAELELIKTSLHKNNRQVSLYANTKCKCQ